MYLSVDPGDHCGDKLKMLLEAALQFPKEIQTSVKRLRLEWKVLDGKIMPFVDVEFK